MSGTYDFEKSVAALLESPGTVIDVGCAVSSADREAIIRGTRVAFDRWVASTNPQNAEEAWSAWCAAIRIFVG